MAHKTIVLYVAKVAIQNEETDVKIPTAKGKIPKKHSDETTTGPKASQNRPKNNKIVLFRVHTIGMSRELSNFETNLLLDL